MTFEAFAQTPLGRALVAIIEAADLLDEYRQLSAQQRPAVAAAAPRVAALIQALVTKEEQDFAKRFCGWAVGVVMRRMGYRIIRHRGRIRNSIFGEGAVWGVDPSVVQVLSARPAGCDKLIQMTVFRGPEGHPTAEWQAIQSVEGAAPVDAALASARNYAAKVGINTIVVSDPEHLLPLT